MESSEMSERTLGARLGARLASEDFVVVVLALIACGILATLPQELHQDGWLAFLGGRLVSDGLPHHEVLTAWAQGQGWVDQQWLGQLVFYGLYALGGAKLAVLSGGLCGLAAVVLSAVGARRLGGGVKATTLVEALAILTLVYFWVTRTQILAFPLYVVVCYLLVRDARRPSVRVLWTLPLLVVWANLHGSVLLGGALVCLRGLLALAERPRGAALGRSILLVLAPLTALATPYGWAVVHYYRLTAGNPTFAHAVSEWRPTTLSLATAGFFLLLAAAVALVARYRDAFSWFELLALLATAVLALDALRNIAWFSLLALLLLPQALSRRLPDGEDAVSPRIRRLVAGGALAVVALFLLVAALKPESWYRGGYRPQLEQAVATAARAHPGALVYANERYADWLLLEDQPLFQGRVAYDARFELMTAAQIKRVVVVSSAFGPGWPTLIRQGALVVLPRSLPAAKQLLKRPREFRVLYRDQDALVALRR